MYGERLIIAWKNNFDVWSYKKRKKVYYCDVGWVTQYFKFLKMSHIYESLEVWFNIFKNGTYDF